MQAAKERRDALKQLVEGAYSEKLAALEAQLSALGDADSNSEAALALVAATLAAATPTELLARSSLLENGLGQLQAHGVDYFIDRKLNGTLTLYLDGKPCGMIAEGLVGPLHWCTASYYKGKVVRIHTRLGVPSQSKKSFHIKRTKLRHKSLYSRTSIVTPVNTPTRAVHTYVRKRTIWSTIAW